MKIGVVIPAYQEEESVGRVVKRVLAAIESSVCRVVVADNASTDRTAAVAVEAGAEVVSVPQRGYGAACLGAIEALQGWPDVFVFLDADGSSRPEEIPLLLEALQENRTDLVLGCRHAEGPMTPPQRWGTWLAVTLTNFRWGTEFADMGPFRAVTRSGYEGLKMRDRTWGWTIEMQILAARAGLGWREVPVSWEQRIGGRSKISGTFSGIVRAGGRILWTVARYWVG